MNKDIENNLIAEVVELSKECRKLRTHCVEFKETIEIQNVVIKTNEDKVKVLKDAVKFKDETSNVLNQSLIEKDQQIRKLIDSKFTLVKELKDVQNELETLKGASSFGYKEQILAREAVEAVCDHKYDGTAINGIEICMYCGMKKPFDPKDS